MSARAVMVCGTTSGAGKSFLTTALCRWYARQGLTVAPFKAQNMSNNARVVAGGEIGSAQYFQALAARATPEVRMNPVLLKPEQDTQSQVLVLGQPDFELSRMAWRGRSERVWPAVREALRALMADNDVVVIEGAGSPAEINLKTNDIVNMRVALEVRARVLLVSDIDRGGSFAHLYGTHQFLTPQERALIKGFVLNKFRGDADLLAPGPEMLRQLTGVPTVAVLPMWWGHGLPEEDGVFDARSSGSGLHIAVLAYPRISNLDEFQPLKNIDGVQLSWARDPAELERADLLILPGSKHTADDLRWVRERKLDQAITGFVASGRPLLGICGGLQMLGEALLDPHQIEGNGPGLGVLPLVTQYLPNKTQRHTQARFADLSGFWSPLSGVPYSGYEIRHGITAARTDLAQTAPLQTALPDGLGWQAGNVLAVYTHGLFENASVVKALFGAQAPALDDTFERLADFVDIHFDRAFLMSLLEARAP